jgi:hypothetical protein
MAIKKGKSVSVIAGKQDRVQLEDAAKKLIENNVRDIEKPVHEFKTLAEQVAKSSVFIKNYYLDDLREQYKHHDRVKRFDKFFLYARLGESLATTTLYVDEPLSEYDLEVCYKKAKIMKDLKLNYVIVESDTTLFDAQNQLGVA